MNEEQRYDWESGEGLSHIDDPAAVDAVFERSAAGPPRYGSDRAGLYMSTGRGVARIAFEHFQHELDDALAG